MMRGPVTRSAAARRCGGELPASGPAFRRSGVVTPARPENSVGAAGAPRRAEDKVRAPALWPVHPAQTVPCRPLLVAAIPGQPRTAWRGPLAAARSSSGVGHGRNLCFRALPQAEAFSLVLTSSDHYGRMRRNKVTGTARACQGLFGSDFRCGGALAPVTAPRGHRNPSGRPPAPSWPRPTAGSPPGKAASTVRSASAPPRLPWSGLPAASGP
jgi:hypothetical protein